MPWPTLAPPTADERHRFANGCKRLLSLFRRAPGSYIFLCHSRWVISDDAEMMQAICPVAYRSRR